jgi:transcriptional regulator with XRE-family HTH domain
MELVKENRLKDKIEIPYGYSKKIANVLGLSQNTITKVAKGENKNPVTRMKVISLLEKMLTEDLENCKF